MVVAAAAVVVAAGGAGLLGPLGALVGVSDTRSVSEARATGPRGGAPADAIVAAAPAAPARSRGAARGAPRGTARPGGPTARGDRPRGPVGRIPPRRRAGAPPSTSPGPAAGGGAQPPPAPPGRPRLVDQAGKAVDDALAAGGEPAKPVRDPVRRVTESAAQACRDLPVCP
jgi:hypothetical protein